MDSIRHSSDASSKLHPVWLGDPSVGFDQGRTEILAGLLQVRLHRLVGLVHLTKMDKPLEVWRGWQSLTAAVLWVCDLHMQPLLFSIEIDTIFVYIHIRTQGMQVRIYSCIARPRKPSHLLPNLWCQAKERGADVRQELLPRLHIVGGPTELVRSQVVDQGVVQVVVALHALEVSLRW